MKTNHLLYAIVLSLLILTPNNASSQESVKIGNQVWMTKNLDVDRFRNGDIIPHAKTDDKWSDAFDNESPAWSYLDNDPANGKQHGKIYNWYAINDPRGLASKGWKVPTVKDWETLVANLKNPSDKRKLGWTFNRDNDNPEVRKQTFGGYRHRFGSFSWENQRIYYWTSTAISHSDAWTFMMADEFNQIFQDGGKKSNGNYVRCIKEE